MTKRDHAKYVRPQHLADKLGISKGTLFRWERIGVIPPAQRFGVKTVRFNEDATLEALGLVPGRD